MNKIRHFVLANSMSWVELHLVLDKRFNQTLYVSYSTEFTVYWKDIVIIIANIYVSTDVTSFDFLFIFIIELI